MAIHALYKQIQNLPKSFSVLTWTTSSVFISPKSRMALTRVSTLKAAPAKKERKKNIKSLLSQISK